MTSIIRVATAANKVLPTDSAKCLNFLWECVEEMNNQNPDIMLFPTLSLSGNSGGALLHNNGLADRAQVALEQLCIMSAEISSWLIVGLPYYMGGKICSVMAVINQGAVRGLVPALDAPKELYTDAYSDEILPIDTVFACGSFSFSIIAGDIQKLPTRMHLLKDNGCDLVLVPSCTPVTAGSKKAARDCAKQISRDFGIAVGVANGGSGEASSPFLYQSWCGVWECGKELAYSDAVKPNGNVTVVADVDVDIVKACKVSKMYTKPHFVTYPQIKDGLLRTIEKKPFIAGFTDIEYIELFELQAKSLANRLQNTGFCKLVIAVSGGLDSTLALLVGCRALDLCGLPAQNLIAITMPGFGTGDRTYHNAVELIDALQVEFREISIKRSCLMHFEDIGLDETDRSVAYENAQARERTQIVMDIANMEGAIVIGTGDMSEAALGWCTYGGDHLAGFNVNICLTKDMVRNVTAAVAEVSDIRVGLLLHDILDTPVSPELLPPDENGNITQKSEEILGPYKLHDFFLYYLIRYNMRPSKIYRYACIAFSGEMSAPYIKEKLVLFLKRFCGSQWKRNCETDAAAIVEPNLTSCGFRFESDINATALLAELNEV